jgi:molybdenum cofactor cytidylyltransferase
VRFGETLLEQAEGHILAHSLRLADGVLKKGKVLDSGDLRRLDAAGHRRIVTACLEPGDVPEDEAAQRLARALTGAGVRAGAPFTGRCNLFAAARGLLQIDAACIDAVNRVHESLTVATLAAPAVVDVKQMLATVKVIPFAVPQAALDAAVAAAGGGRAAHLPAAIALRSFRPLRAALVQTRLHGTRESVLDKTARVLAARVHALDGVLADERRCAHAVDAVAAAVAAQLDAGHELVLVSGASAIVDRRDVVPAGIVAAGGELVHFGMPMDPGNLLLVARRGAVPILGLPGCARSPRYNGLDAVLERLAADLPVAPGDVMGMGVGGLLKEIPERPQPRASSVSSVSSARAPQVTAVLLAGGQSRRMGSLNKLLAPVDGVPMVRATLECIIAGGVDRVLVVTGHESERVRAALHGLRVDFVHNPHYAQGLSTSLACGIGALRADVDAALVCLGDMPRVRPQHVQRLLAAFDPLEGRSICVPTHRGKRGNPVLWDRRYFAQMRAVRGDVGARHIIGEHLDAVCEVEMDDAGVLLDVDSPQALAELASS